MDRVEVGNDQGQMEVLTYAVIVVLVLIGIVLFVVLPAVGIRKALPEIRRMLHAPRVPPEDAPINASRAIMRAADRADVHRIRPRHRSERPDREST